MFERNFNLDEIKDKSKTWKEQAAITLAKAAAYDEAYLKLIERSVKLPSAIRDITRLIGDIEILKEQIALNIEELKQLCLYSTVKLSYREIKTLNMHLQRAKSKLVRKKQINTKKAISARLHRLAYNAIALPARTKLEERLLKKFPVEPPKIEKLSDREFDQTVKQTITEILTESQVIHPVDDDQLISMLEKAYEENKIKPDESSTDDSKADSDNFYIKEG